MALAVDEEVADIEEVGVEVAELVADDEEVAELVADGVEVAMLVADDVAVGVEEADLVISDDAVTDALKLAVVEEESDIDALAVDVGLGEIVGAGAARRTTSDMPSARAKMRKSASEPVKRLPPFVETSPLQPTRSLE